MRPARTSRQYRTSPGIAKVAGVCVLVVAGQLATVSAAFAVPAASPVAAAAEVPGPIDLGTAETFSALAGVSVANTGASTALSGDLGLDPAGTTITGIQPAMVKGSIHDKNPVAAQAHSDQQAAYAEVVALPPNPTPFAGDQAGKTFGPGVHTTAAAFTNTGTMTLDAGGDPSAVFVFQIGAAYTSAANSKVVLTGGALANNVFWQVVGATSFGAGATSAGTYLSAGAFALGDGAKLKGRALTASTLAMTNNLITEPKDDFIPPGVTIVGGASRSTSDATPAISGTTDEPAGEVIVTVGDQKLTTSAGESGAWSVSTNALTQGTHTVVATVLDASQNVGSATQELTVDTTAPAVAIEGGASEATKDQTPTIAGTTEVPTGAPVTVTVAGHVLTTEVADGGTWSVDAPALSEAAHHVVASVDDAAQNTGEAHQVLTVDVTLPVLAIDGGPTHSTTDTSPWIEGTTAEQAGTTVRLTVGGQDLAATVLTGGTWKVSATELPAGSYVVVAWINDAARNTGTARQMLTVGPVVPTDTFRPDAAIRSSSGSYVGVGTYGAGQRVAKQLRGQVRTARFEVRVTNRGDASDQLEVVGTARDRKFAVTYLAAGTNVTDAVTAGRFTTGALAPGESTVLVMRVTRSRASRVGDARAFFVQTVSTRAPAVTDRVGAFVKVAR